MEPREITVTEAAKSLGITNDAVRRAINRKTIQGRKLCDSNEIWLVTVASVEAYRAYTQPEGVPKVGRPRKDKPASVISNDMAV